MSTGIEISGVDFATVFVTDYPASVQFYGETLGLEQSFVPGLHVRLGVGPVCHQ